ncbi:MAG: zinc metallopeptidase [Bacilli bacterium]|nr:zinc metallopeptidase [Bacilli bacterium]
MDSIIIDYGLIIIAMIISGSAQMYINHWYNKTKKIKTAKGMNGQQTARKILDKNDLKDVGINEVAGTLSDHYDPAKKTVNLSNDIYATDSIASISVAAHECGHAIQDKNGYFFLRLRRGMVPFVNLASKLGYVAILIGIFFSIFGLLKIGILLEIVILVFQLITLPVEFDASSRALKKIEEYGIVTKDELKYCKNMLRSAALTYVAGVTASLLQVLRLVLILRRND